MQPSLATSAPQSTVLVADCDVYIVRILTTVLIREGYHVVGATDLTSVRSHLADRPFALLCDVRLLRNGTTARELKDLSPETRVALVGAGEDATQGFDAAFPKPLRSHGIRERLSSWKSSTGINDHCDTKCDAAPIGRQGSKAPSGIIGIDPHARPTPQSPGPIEILDLSESLSDSVIESFLDHLSQEGSLAQQLETDPTQPNDLAEEKAQDQSVVASPTPRPSEPKLLSFALPSVAPSDLETGEESRAAPGIPATVIAPEVARAPEEEPTRSSEPRPAEPEVKPMPFYVGPAQAPTHLERVTPSPEVTETIRPAQAAGPSDKPNEPNLPVARIARPPAPEMPVATNKSEESDPLLHVPIPVPRPPVALPPATPPATTTAIPADASQASLEPSSPATPLSKVDFKNVLPEKAISSRGNLEEHSLPLLMMYAYTEIFTGRLRLSRDDASRTIYFANGFPCRVDSTILRENLGRLLVGTGKLTEEDISRAAEYVAAGYAQGEALLTLGVLNARELLEALREQTRVKLVNSFAWQSGNFEFVSDEQFMKEGSLFELNPLRIIFDGIREHASINDLAKTFHPFTAGYINRGSIFDVHAALLPFLPSVRTVLETIKQHRTVGAVLAAGGAEFQETLKALYFLTVTQLVELDATSGDIPSCPDARGSILETDPAHRAEIDRRCEIIADLYLHLPSLKPEGVLGIAATATETDIQVAFHRVCKAFHPEALPEKIGGEYRNKAEALLRIVSQARDTLLAAAHKRKEVEEENSRQVARQTAIQSERARQRANRMKAEAHCKRAMVCLRQQNLQDAHEEITAACRLVPEEPEYLTQLGWITYLRGEPDTNSALREAGQCLKSALRLDPRHPTAMLYTGHLYQKWGKSQQARHCYQTALRFDPACTEARDALARLDQQATHVQPQKKPRAPGPSRTQVFRPAQPPKTPTSPQPSRAQDVRPAPQEDIWSGTERTTREERMASKPQERQASPAERLYRDGKILASSKFSGP